MNKSKLLMDAAVIFEVIKNGDDSIRFVPNKIVIGTYIGETKSFIDRQGNKYQHILNAPNNYGFACRYSLTDIKKVYPNLPFAIIKSKILKSLNEYDYTLAIADNKAPLVLKYSKEDEENSRTYVAFFDHDSAIYYIKNYPDLAEKFFDIESEENECKEEPSKEPVQEGPVNIDIRKLYCELTQNIIGQDEPIRAILTAIWKQYSNFSSNKSRNIFINGSTGVGKTEIFRLLSKKLDIPLYLASATQYTASGYVGRCVEDMLSGLVKNANGDVHKAERGILIIDEIDKLSEAKRSTSSVNHGDVQNELLKIVEDGTFYIKNGEEEIAFNTSNLLVVAMGSFSRIEIESKTPIGFDPKTITKRYQDLTRDDFIANGMLPDFIGRFPVIVQMNELTFDNYLQILKSSPLNTLAMNRSFLEKYGIKLTIDDDVLIKIATMASLQKFGARSLDEIIEKTLSSAFFEIAIDATSYQELIITPETIANNKVYTLVRKK